MENNEADFIKYERKIYNRALLVSFQNDYFSKLWPKSLDKTFINNNGQWDPFKFYDNIEPNTTKKNILQKQKCNKTDDKNKDDMFLRPVQRTENGGWKDINNKLNNIQNTFNGVKKCYARVAPNNGGGDFEGNNCNRNINPRNYNCANDKTEPAKFSKNNSNLETHKYEKENIWRNGNHVPEWFLNELENSNDVMELHEIRAHDTEIISFKKNSSRSQSKTDVGNGVSTELDQTIINFATEKSFCGESCIESLKREGSRFREIFQKESKRNNLMKTKELENIIKAALLENVLMIDEEMLNIISKPLPNGAVMVEEIEKAMTNPLGYEHVPSKSNTMFGVVSSNGPSEHSVRINDITNQCIFNPEVTKEPTEIEYTRNSQELQNCVSLNNMVSNRHSDFSSGLHCPPGFSIMLNNRNLPNQQLLQKQKCSGFLNYLSMNQANDANTQYLNCRTPNMLGAHPSSNNELNYRQDMHDHNILSGTLSCNRAPLSDCSNTHAYSLTITGSPPGLPSLRVNDSVIKCTHLNKVNHFSNQPIAINDLIGQRFDSSTFSTNHKSTQINSHISTPLRSQSHSLTPDTMLAHLFNVSGSWLPPLPAHAKYADQIETENNYGY